MARGTTLPSSKMLILLGDGADPESFTSPCGLTTKGFNNSAETNDVNVPDCDNPDAPFWVERVIVSLSSTVSGSGIMMMEALPAWREWFESGESRNLRVKLDESAANNGGYFFGKFVLSTFNITGEERGKVQIEIELQNDGVVAWQDAV